jgi:hypothetical protein
VITTRLSFIVSGRILDTPRHPRKHHHHSAFATGIPPVRTETTPKASENGRNPGTAQPELGITEQAVQRILADLTADGFLKVKKVGRRNEYRIVRTKRLRHRLEDRVRIGGILDTISG